MTGSSFVAILDILGETITETVFDLVVSSIMLARRETLGAIIEIPSWSMEGGSLESASLNSSRTEFFYRFDLNGLNAFY